MLFGNKRIIAAVLSGLLLLSGFAYASEADLSAMSREELISLRDEINDILASQSRMESAIISSGPYVVGEERYSGDSDAIFGMIRPGIYEVSFLSSSEQSEDFLDVWVYNNWGLDDEQYSFSVLRPDSPSTIITLDTGDAIEVANGSVTITRLESSEIFF